MSTSTVAKGNELRDRVAGWLRAAGYGKIETEKYIQGKVVDVYFEQGGLTPQRCAIECKNWNTPLVKSRISEIVFDYGALENAGEIDSLIVINPNELGTHAKEVIRQHHWIQFYTWNSFKTRLIDFDPYLRRVIEENEHYQPSEYYVRPYTSDGMDLEARLEEWLNDVDAPPAAILATYGMGKTTFANHFAARLAKQCLSGEFARIPILLRLGDLVAEQDLDGLLGKLFTKTYQVGNFRYDVFRQLNDEGHLLVIADGFDEMKRSLDPYELRHNFEQLYGLCRGAAKLLLLGRPTVFLTEEERTFFLRGGNSLGDALETEDFKPTFREIDLRGFSDDDVRVFVRGYLNHQRRDHAKDYPHIDDAFVERRVAALADERVSTLARRPVHAQMLARLFANRDFELETVSGYELYDKFVRFMASREQKKAARSLIELEDRIRFERHLGWWHWRKGLSNNFRAADIPPAVVSVVDARRPMKPQRLQRDLLAGSILEITGEEFRFPHRSFSEFFVAQYILFEANSEESLAIRARYLNREILSFIAQWKKTSAAEGVKIFRSWYDDLGRQRGKMNPLMIDLIANDDDLGPELSKDFDGPHAGEIGRLPFFQLICRTTASLRENPPSNEIARVGSVLVGVLHSASDGYARAAAVFGLRLVFHMLLDRREHDACVDLCHEILTKALTDRELADVVQSVRTQRLYRSRQFASVGRTVLHDGFEGYIAEAFLRSLSPFEKENKERAVRFSMASFVNNVIVACSRSYGIEGVENFGRQTSYDFPVQFALREVETVRADLLRTLFTSRIEPARLVLVERR